MTDLLSELEAVVVGIRREAATAQNGQCDRLMALSARLLGHHAEIAAAVRDASVLRSLASAMYQAAGAYDMPVRFLDVLAAAGNGEPITEAQVYALLPCDTPEFVRDKERLDWLDANGFTAYRAIDQVDGLSDHCVVVREAMKPRRGNVADTIREAVDTAMRAGGG